MTTLISTHKRLILLLMLTLVSTGTWAQQETGDSAAKDSATTEEKQTKTEDTSKEKPEKAPQKSTDTFNPTEEISEDLSVSFPVDI